MPLGLINRFVVPIFTEQTAGPRHVFVNLRLINDVIPGSGTPWVRKHPAVNSFRVRSQDRVA